MSERQDEANALLEAYILNFLAKLQAQSSDDSDSDQDDTLSASSSSDSSSDDPVEEGILLALESLYSTRYQVKRRDIPKTDQNIELLLGDYKQNHPENFRSYLRMSPACFDTLVTTIQYHPIFLNDSNNSQMPVERQVAIALCRFGHYGNAVSTMKVALWAGVGYGTVKNATVRVMTAVCDARFRAMTMPWPDATQIESAKAWVEANSCFAWRDGWLMVDGTLIPLFRRPAEYGTSFFDRKSNYSMNVQLISTPDLRIIDYGVGLPGSQHDATAWNKTRLPHEHQELLSGEEFVWADSAYPLKKWCQSPYKECVLYCIAWCSSVVSLKICNTTITFLESVSAASTVLAF
ncbi:hypothetical protein BDN70DRAFT_895188 [Pholiota conissans]|uniref:DDE Tnp4 domain-containing protein n=1 Tax=Pholiota conissans TaxID=109636 RepID=A0A9P6D0A9_9AGAR|nr:hypothetical protein BDN70DRAFT_895188 [Pholiota conissans]